MTAEQKQVARLCKHCDYWLRWATTEVRAHSHRNSPCMLKTEVTNKNDSCECWSNK